MIAPSLEMMDVACGVCGATAHRTVMADTLGARPPVFGYKWTPEVRKSYRMVRCDACGHVYASPRLRDMYRHYVDNTDETYLANSDLRTATARRVMEVLAAHVPSGRLLDVGCATGDFLSVAAERYAVEGLELSQWAAARARERGLRIRAETIEDVAKTGQKYDLVTMWGVIEHLENPLDELRRIRAMLNPGGCVALWTGDVDSWYARLFGARWWYVMGQHIQLFSRASLAQAFATAGFRPVHRGVYPYVIRCGYLAESLGRYPVAGALAGIALRSPWLRDKSFVLRMSDEIFDVFRVAD